MSGSLIRIKEIIKDLSPSEKKVAEYILKNTAVVSDLSIKELSEKCKSSQAAVVRLCKKLHYNGYKDLRIMIAKEEAAFENEKSMYTDIKPGDDLSTIIRNIGYNNEKSIDDSVKILSQDSVQKAVKAIVGSDRIDFYGIGASYIVCLDAFQKFTRINKNVRTSQDPHMQAQFASNLKKGDAAVAVSYSGETKDTYDAIKIAKAAGALTISITKFGHNAISDLCDIKLFVTSSEITFRSGAMSSRIAQLNLIDILYTAAASSRFGSIKKYLENTRIAIADKKIK